MNADADLEALDKLDKIEVEKSDQEDEDEEAVEIKEKGPKGILMDPNERNTTKSVFFDEENNIVREFNKHQKIEKGKPPKFKKD